MSTSTSTSQRNDQILSKMYADESAKLCTLQGPNLAQLYQVTAPQLMMPPASRDEVKILYLHVDLQPDFTWPFTFVKDGHLHYVMFTEMRGVVKIPPQMAKYVVWE